jgi:rRNA maturation RNase YbeY
LAINFFSEQISFNLSKKRVLKKWINHAIVSERKKLGIINFIFTSDDYLLSINRKYLNHDYYTDIITFNYNESVILSGDIFVSIDTVKANSKIFSSEFHFELYRVIIHGILHLIGYNDINNDLRKVMRDKEDFYMEQLKAKFLLR